VFRNRKALRAQGGSTKAAREGFKYRQGPKSPRDRPSRKGRQPLQKTRPHPSLRIRKLVCDDRHQDRKCCYRGQDSYRQSAPVKNDAKTGHHLAFVFSPSSTSRRLCRFNVDSNRLSIVVARFINQTSAYFDRLRIDASFFKCANVQKHIWSARIGLNKSKAPAGIPPCQRTEGHYFFALSPSSTRRRMASERPGPSSCLAAQASTAAEVSGGSLTALTG
jgi:hypothetical protein